MPTIYPGNNPKNALRLQQRPDVQLHGLVHGQNNAIRENVPQDQELHPPEQG